MSVIAAKVIGPNIVISSDSIIVKDDLKRTNFIKLRNYGNLVVGGCGSAEELCLFFNYIDQHKPEHLSVSKLINVMKEFLIYKRDYVDEDLKNEYIFAGRDGLFITEGMFVQQIKDYTAIGEGEPYALAALHLGHTTEEAVECACDLCCHVAKPIVTHIVNVF